MPEDFVFVALDDDTLNLSGVDEAEISASPELQVMKKEFPWSRAVYAALIDKLVNAGARVIGIDILFTTPREGDEALHAALKQYPNRVVLASNFSQANMGQNNPAPPQMTFPIETVLSPEEAVYPHVGFINFWQEETARASVQSGIISEFSYQIRMSQFTDLPENPYEPVYFSFAACMLKTAGLADRFPDKPMRFRDAANLKKAVRTVSLYSIFVPSLWKSSLGDGEAFRNKIVIIGPSASQFHDVYTSPGGVVLGPLLHVIAMGALLKNAFYTGVSPAGNSLIICGLGVIIFLCALPVRRFWLFPLLLVVVLVGYYAALLTVFTKWSVLPGVLLPTLTILISSLSLFAYQYAKDLSEKLRTRRTLERYVSRNLVQEILDDRGDFEADLAGTRKNVAVLFSDIRGFTQFSENRDPHEVVRHLNEYLTAMVEIVFRFNGTLDKFVGDAVMAVWGNVRSEGETQDAMAATQAAVAMLAALQRLNEKWHPGSGEKFQIGIGINCGTVLFGNIGSEQKSDLTVIGDAVNLASRIESLTKFYRVSILLGENAADKLHGKIPMRFVDRIAVVGRKSEADLYAPILNEKNELYTPSWLETYDEGVKHFRQRDFTRAKELFEKCPQDDELVRHYIAASAKFAISPPPENEALNLRPSSGK